MVDSNKNLSTNELYKKLAEYIDTKFEEQKRDIKELVQEVENKNKEIEERIILLERKIRKNNIVIFGIKTKKEYDLLTQVLGKLNSVLGSDINPVHINDIYRIGKKDTVVLEFISNLQKREIFKEVKRLKGTGISISNDLCKEDKRNNQILYNHLKSARCNNQKAYIRNNVLYVNNQQFTAKQLENCPETSFADDSDILLEPKSSSAPPTPTVRELDNLLLEEDNDTESQELTWAVASTSQANKGKLINKTYRTNSQSEYEKTRSLRSKSKKI